MGEMKVEKMRYGGALEAHVVVLIGQLTHAGRRLLFEVERLDLAGVASKVLQTVGRRQLRAGTRQARDLQLPVLVGAVADEEAQRDVVLLGVVGHEHCWSNNRIAQQAQPIGAFFVFRRGRIGDHFLHWI